MVTKWYPLAPGFTVELLPPAAIPPEIERRIAAIWAEQTRLRGDSLFDGPAYTLVDYSPALLRLRPNSYRYTLARRLDSALAGAIHVRPMAVCGLLLCPDGLVLGKRAADVTAPGLWESAPAGSLAMPDPVTQFLDEVEEELGLTRADVGTPMVIGMVEEDEWGALDIVFRLDCALSGAEIIERHRLAGSAEYDRIAVIAISDLAGFLADHAHDIVSILPPMLFEGGILPE